MPAPEDLTWDLSPILSDLAAFDAAVHTLNADLERLTQAADRLGEPGSDTAWDAVVPALADLSDRIHEVVSWATCTAAAHTDRDDARRADAQARALYSASTRAWSTPVSLVARCSADAFARLLASPALADHRPALEHARARRPVLLPPAEQQLFDELANDALHGWGQHYQVLSGRLRIELDGQALSPSQAKNRLESANPDLRRRAQDAIETDSLADDCAESLSRIIGVRSTLHKRLGVDELAIPLVEQRIQRQTLTALIASCQQAAPLVSRYLAARARLSGNNQVDWQDLTAPMGKPRTNRTYRDARALVADQLHAFSPSWGTSFATRSATAGSKQKTAQPSALVPSVPPFPGPGKAASS
ncbi:MAG: M3 family oligoendopeptidase [Oligoflexia bacterium]|nr:M3 family oligoendopeptidase [Oligoflexia bacterium]